MTTERATLATSTTICPWCKESPGDGCHFDIDEDHGEGAHAQRIALYLGTTEDERALVRSIRRVCAREFSLPRDDPFFYFDYEDDEPADVALLRLFRAECAAQGVPADAEHVIEITLTLCHG